MKSHCRCAEAPGRPDMDAAATAGHAAAAAEVTACAESREGVDMPVVETETHGQILVVRVKRPDRLNAQNNEVRNLLPEDRTAAPRGGNRWVRNVQIRMSP